MLYAAMKAEGVLFECRSLARFEPVSFDKSRVALGSNPASKLRYNVTSLPSGFF